MAFPKRPILALAFALFALAVGCRKQADLRPDRPRLTPKVILQDVTFHSTALGRDMPYRVVLPATIPVGHELPVVYLLHGGGGGYRDWSNYSDVAQFAEHGLILVMPEGNSSYYVNAAERPNDRFEDYIVKDLISDVESRLPVAGGRANRAIAGVSMGGFGAVVLGLKHPDLFVFVGGLSSVIDVPSRRFSIKRIGQYRQHAAIFGAWGSQTRYDDDPFVLVRSADLATAPYFFLSCGEQEGLCQPIRSWHRCCRVEASSMNFMPVPAVMTGTNGTNGWRGCTTVCGCMVTLTSQNANETGKGHHLHLQHGTSNGRGSSR